MRKRRFPPAASTPYLSLLPLILDAVHCDVMNRLALDGDIIGTFLPLQHYLLPSRGGPVFALSDHIERLDSGQGATWPVTLRTDHLQRMPPIAHM